MKDFDIDIRLVQTQDGSPTLYNATLGEHYHSRHGALQESKHIFIERALKHRISKGGNSPWRILELGFGTGLNALLSLDLAVKLGLEIHYTTLELYPIAPTLYTTLDYQLESLESKALLQALHAAPWAVPSRIAGVEGFVLEKYQEDIRSFTKQVACDVIYFDAFSPEVQPYLWTEEIFASLYEQALPSAVLTTYCAKGEVRRRLQRTGWRVERLAGPPGKREMLRATKD